MYKRQLLQHLLQPQTQKKRRRLNQKRKNHQTALIAINRSRKNAGTIGTENFIVRIDAGRKKMSKLKVPPNEALYPVPVVLISCLNQETKKPNIITIAWCGVVCSKPPLLSVSIRPSRYSYKLIKDTGDFVVNIPSKNLAKKVDLCGIRSGKDIDKFKEFSLNPIPSSKIHSPMIKECPGNIECILRNVVSLGSHDMFIGEVVAFHVDEDITDGNGKIDYNKAGPFVYNHGEYWDLGKQIGYYGFSVK